MRNGQLAKSVWTVLTLGYFILSVAGCSSVKAPASKALAEQQFDLYVNFNGPWAFMQDPDDATKLVVFAPYIMDHQTAYVAGTNETPVETGTYELTGPSPSTLNPNPQLIAVRDQIKRKTFDTASQNSGGRYLIRMPMPSDMVSYRTGLEAVATSWPVPTPNKIEKWYTTHMTLHYRVSDFGIKFSGTADDKTALSFSPTIGITGTLDIGVGPLYDLQETDCHDHGKGAFKALVGLFALKQFIDFRGPDGKYHQDVCAASDPQKTGGPTAISSGHLGRTGADCKAAMLLLTVTN